MLPEKRHIRTGMFDHYIRRSDQLIARTPENMPDATSNYRDVVVDFYILDFFP